MITVHLILNAHIDPVWLWPWQSGVDETIATCRSACDRLDAHPDLVFAKGEAWSYDVIERIDPALFERIRAHVAAGRWEIVGGWWVQPDCNLPTALGLERQIEAGRAWFQRRFQAFPRIAWNVDSFGHAAALPQLLRRMGQDRYVLMRPQEHELHLPARVFRWRGHEGGDEVLTFRIARAYATGEISADHIAAALSGLPPGLDHTMALVGVGDHGGGPTERQIAWCRAHADAFEGARLVFSSPIRFFDAVERQAVPLPVFTGELQHHAVGCYSVTRAIKIGVRDAEMSLGAAETMLTADPRPDPAAAGRIAEAWRLVAFNQFHDTLAGTAIPSAYVQAEAQLGWARATADDILQMGLRRVAASLPDDPRQRIAIFNPSATPFEGHAVLSPWIETRWGAGWRLIDETGSIVAHQPLAQEAATALPRRLLVKLSAPPEGLRVLRIDRAAVEAPADARARRPRTWRKARRIGLGGATADFKPDAVLRLARAVRLRPALQLWSDPTDTWSHGAVRLGEPPMQSADWARPVALDRGPLMASALQAGRIGESRVSAEWRVYRDEPIVELRLRVDWRARREVLKLAIPFRTRRRVDGVMGGQIARDLDGRERPMQGFTWLEGLRGRRLGVTAADVFALDGDPSGVRLTLLRSPLMAHHDPAKAEDFPRAAAADQGVHEFGFAFAAFDALSPEWLAQRAAMAAQPLVFADCTRGMAPRVDL